MSNSMGDIPDSFFGAGRDHSENEPGSDNATDFFLNFSGKKGSSGDIYENLAQLRAENLLVNDKLQKDSRNEGNKRVIVTRKADLKKPPSPEIDLKKISSELYKAYKKRTEVDDKMRDVYINRQIIPVAKQIVELFLRGLDWAIITKEIAKKYPETDKIESALLYIKELADPLVFVSRLATSPELYDNDCGKCREYLFNNHIKIRYVVPIAKCKDCNHWHEEAKICSFFGAKLFCIWIDNEDYERVVTELVARNKLTAAQCHDLKKIPDENDRLFKALKLAAQPIAKRTDWTRISEKDKFNSLEISTANYEGRENAVKSVINDMANGKTISEIRKEVSAEFKDFAGIVNDALARIRIISAESLDTCQTEKYAVLPGMELVRSRKCGICKHADEVSCRRHTLNFTDTTISLSGLNETGSAEAEEILSFFKDSRFEVNYAPVKDNPLLDIHIDNPGQDLIVDVGQTETLGKNLEVGTIFQDILEMRVDVAPLPQNEEEIDISGLESGEGFDLTNLL